MPKAKAPPAFDPTKPRSEVYGDPARAYAQNGWYYDGLYRPVDKIDPPKPLPPEYAAVLRRREEEARRERASNLRAYGGDSGDEELNVELRRRRREDRAARLAEEHAE